MYINKLTIKNFRNIGDSPLEITLKPFTLVIGENNIGKTNLLSAIALLFSQELSVTQHRTLELDDINYDSITTFKKEIADFDRSSEIINFPEVIIEAVLTDMDDDQHSVVGDWYIDKDLNHAQVTYKFSIRSSFNKINWIEEQRKLLQRKSAENSKTELDYKLIDFPVNEYRYLIYGGGRPSNECEARYLKMLRVEILDALRDAERELTPGGAQRLLYRILDQENQSYSDLKSHLLALEQAVRNNDTLEVMKTDVTNLLNRISLATANDVNSIDFHFSAPDTVELLKKIGMIYGSSPISVARNGLGRNNLLYTALLLSQLARTTDLKKVREEDYVCFRFVGIEEPEAHLHPHLQDHLGGNIEEIQRDHSKRLQLLLTSHSTHIAAKLNLANTAIFFRDDKSGKLSFHYVLENIDQDKNKDAIRFLSLYLDATKSRMFFARKIILVEGISEQIVIPALFENAEGKTLESLGCTVLNVNGVAFRHFLTIVRNGFFKKCVVLTDQDTGKKTEDRADKLRGDFEDELIKVQITRESTFEKELIAANRSGLGKKILLDALVSTRPINGPKFRNLTGENDIDIENFFKEIELYKSEFAFNLVEKLRGDGNKLNLPEYISEAFDFIK
jgi:predicted ATP-dependent endonuclease of OLD family